MAEDKSYERSLEGETIYYIARNSEGVIFAKELTLEKLYEAIARYQNPPPIEEKAEEKKPEEAPASEPISSADASPQAKIKQGERKKQSKKISFWDKLK